MTYTWPPTLHYHLTDGHAPKVYTVFWVIGGFFLLVVFVAILPRIYEVLQHGRSLRDRTDQILLPTPYLTVLLILLFPLIISICNFIVLISPITDMPMVFIIHCYESLCLIYFARIFIMLLGSPKGVIKALSETQPTRFWAAPPYGCCFLFFLEKRFVTKRDFRYVYTFIVQYALLAPFYIFLEMYFLVRGENKGLKAVRWIALLSAGLCLEGLFALLIAARFLLNEFKIHGKFWSIKLSVVAVVIPSLVTSVFPVHGINDVYDSDVLSAAWGNFLTLICVGLLSIMFVRYWGAQDCEDAYINDYQSSYKASRASALHIKNDILQLNIATENSRGINQNIGFTNSNSDNDNKKSVEMQQVTTQSADANIVYKSNDETNTPTIQSD